MFTVRDIVTSTVLMLCSYACLNGCRSDSISNPSSLESVPQIDAGNFVSGIVFNWPVGRTATLVAWNARGINEGFTLGKGQILSNGYFRVHLNKPPSTYLSPVFGLGCPGYINVSDSAAQMLSGYVVFDVIGDSTNDYTFGSIVFQDSSEWVLSDSGQFQTWFVYSTSPVMAEGMGFCADENIVYNYVFREGWNILYSVVTKETPTLQITETMSLPKRGIWVYFPSL